MATTENILDMTNSSKSTIDIGKFRNIVKSYISRHQYVAAEFWANKLVSLGGACPVDVYNLAQCYFHLKQYHRAVFLLNSHNLSKIEKCRYLMARCHYEVGEYQMAMDVLDHSKTSLKNEESSLIIMDAEDELTPIESSIHLLRGYIQEAVDNRTLAVESFKAALYSDPFCYEAFRALTQHHMLPMEEEKELLQSLPFSNPGSDDDESMLLKISYETQLNKYSGSKLKLSSSLVAFEENLDFLSAQAETLYYQSDFNRCFKLTRRILEKDPYHPQCILVHVACLVELKKSNDLFLLAHKLVDYYPEEPLSWFAVGCYYYLTGKYDNARRFLSKATTLDRMLGPAWIAYGHAFAAENEHDQARAAYYKAAQLMQGCHLPLLYIGMEYSLTSNPKFAEKFFHQALEIAPQDPFVHHELGVVAFANLDYHRAESYFVKAIALLEDNNVNVLPEKWGPLLQNLGQTYLKLGKYEDAKDFLCQALRVCPGSPSIYTALGLVKAYTGDYLDAVESLHKALSLQRDHTVASSLLTTLMNQVMVNAPLDVGDCDEVFEAGLSECHKRSSIQANSKPAQPAHLNNSSMDYLKSVLGTSIGKPVMHSSDINQSTRSQVGLSADSSLMASEDMEMDDETP